MIQDGINKLNELKNHVAQVGIEVNDIWGLAEELTNEMPENGEATSAAEAMAAIDGHLTEIKSLVEEAGHKFDAI
jgi:hypothetical protein